jgi:small neutral amino acid transporter SnatA (MarC family)
MGKPIDTTVITFYLVTGLVGYGMGLLSIAAAREATECYIPIFYTITGLILAAVGIIFIIAAVKEAIKKARGEGYG